MNTLVIILLCLILVIVQVAGITKTVYAAGDFLAADRYINAALKRHNIPGMAMAITQGDQIAYSKGYGTAGDGRAVTVTANTPFFIGSHRNTLGVCCRQGLDGRAPSRPGRPSSPK